MIRAALAATAVLFVAVGTVSAAGPLIGGTLTAYDGYAVVYSNATMPVEVTMTGSDVNVTPRSFTLESGQSATVELLGPRKGTLSARLAVLDAPGSGDTASVTLQVNLTPATTPVDWSGALYGLLGLAALAVILRKVRPWEFRVARKAD